MSICRLCILLFPMVILNSIGRGEDFSLLAQRIKKQEVSAIREAGDQGRRDMIPLLRETYAIRMAATEPVHIAAQSALAKLGEEKYLVEILDELLHPAAAAAYESEYLYSIHCGASRDAAEASAVWVIQQAALKKLIYLQDERTVQYVAPLLYETRPIEVGHLADTPLAPKSSMAVQALSRIVKNNMLILEGRTRLNNEMKIIAWQKWWEAHKDYYQKLKPILPLSPAATSKVPTRNIPSSIVVAPQVKSLPPAPVPPLSSQAAKQTDPIYWRLLVGIGGLVLVAVVMIVMLRKRGKSVR